MISLDCNHTIMAAAGHQAGAFIEGIRTEYTGKHIVAFEGNPPPIADGMCCVVDRRFLADPWLERCADAAAVFTSGPRRWWGCTG